jgi:hypothetical protein
MLARWPKGKHESEVFDAVRQFTRTLVEQHKNKHGQHIPLRFLDATSPPVVISAGLFTQEVHNRDDNHFFLRATEIAVDYLEHPTIAVASGSVRFRFPSGHAIFAGGPVQADYALKVIIVGFGDVTLRSLHKSLVIARGKVTCKGSIVDSCIISGQSVAYKKELTRNSQIMENESHPLGLIQFSDKSQKPAPGQK